jgi:hypothetical protein
MSAGREDPPMAADVAHYATSPAACNYFQERRRDPIDHSLIQRYSNVCFLLLLLNPGKTCGLFFTLALTRVSIGCVALSF